MGIDLTIGLLNYQKKTDNYWFEYSRLSFDRNYDVFSLFGLERSDKYKKLINEKKIPVNTKLERYTDEGCKEVTENAYGEQITWFYAGDLRNLPKDIDTSDWNKGILSLLQTINEKTIVILWWC